MLFGRIAIKRSFEEQRTNSTRPVGNSWQSLVFDNNRFPLCSSVCSPPLRPFGILCSNVDSFPVPSLLLPFILTSDRGVACSPDYSTSHEISDAEVQHSRNLFQAIRCRSGFRAYRVSIGRLGGGRAVKICHSGTAMRRNRRRWLPGRE